MKNYTVVPTLKPADKRFKKPIFIFEEVSIKNGKIKGSGVIDREKVNAFKLLRHLKAQTLLIYKDKGRIERWCKLTLLRISADPKTEIIVGEVELEVYLNNIRL